MSDTNINDLADFVHKFIKYGIFASPK